MRIEELGGSMSEPQLELEVRIRRYEQQGTANDPMDFAAFGTVVAGGEAAGLAPGAAVEMRMSDEPSDSDRLIKDLRHGSEVCGVEECGPGSVVRFVCFTDGPADPASEKIAKGVVLRATTFDVIVAVPVPGAPDDGPRQEDGGPMHGAFLNRRREQEDGGPMHGIIRPR